MPPNLKKRSKTPRITVYRTHNEAKTKLIKKDKINSHVRLS
jgi:hypothetical protein